MVSRKNEIVVVCTLLGLVVTVLISDGLDAPPLVSAGVLVLTAATLPMVINNYLESGEGG